MINYRQKQFTEYDAMRQLYVKLMDRSDRFKFPIIDVSALPPILRGNNVVIEKFVTVTSFFGRDKYRMYLKIGSRAKLPDEVRLPERVYDKKLGSIQVKISGGFGSSQPQAPTTTSTTVPTPTPEVGITPGPDPGTTNTKRGRGPRGERQKNMSRLSLFSKNNKPGQPNSGGGGGGQQQQQVKGGSMSSSFNPQVDLSYQVSELLGTAVKFCKKTRSLVLDFNTINDAIEALNILPFGLGYKIYLLNA